MNLDKIRKYDYRILIWLFAAIPLIDVLNGTIITVLNFDTEFSLGKFYRIITIVVLSYILLKYSDRYNQKKHIINFGIAAAIVGIYLLVFFIYHGEIKGVIFDAVSISKLFLIIMIIYSLKYLYDKDLIDIMFITEIFDLLSIIFPTTMLIPYFLGIGSATYSSGLGYTGLYYANNDLSIVMLVSTIYCLNNLIKRIRTKEIILFILNLMSLLIIGSKTGLLGLGIAIILYIIKYMKNIVNNKSISKKHITRIFIYIGVIIIISIIVFYPIFSEMLHRIIYFYQKEGNILAAFLSGREKFLVVAFEKLTLEKFFIFKLLFGVGFFYRKNWGIGELVEMDLFDIVFSLGLIAAIVITYYISKFLYKMVRNLNDSNFMYFVCILVILLFSIIAGHVAFSALSGSIFALTMFGGYISTDRSNTSNKI